MKILFISMPSLHAIRWIENLNVTHHQLFWFDVLNRGNFKRELPLEEFTNWKQRKRNSTKGEYFLSKKFPWFYEKIQHLVETTVGEELEIIIEKIRPDVIHSFEMQSCSYPILKTMRKHPEIKWIYSCWGSDLFFYKNQWQHRIFIKKVLRRVDMLQTDSVRDYDLALQLGFKGKFSGVIPGGGGYKIKNLLKFCHPIENRNIILVKGYQHSFGRSLAVLKALEDIQDKLKSFKIVVFAAHPAVVEYIKFNKLPYQHFRRHEMSQEEVLKLMGKSLIFIGNSISDGIPNTLIEAFIMGAFPIQSNPGGVSEELIKHQKNGLLISAPENVEHLKSLILEATSGKIDFLKSAKRNQEIAMKRFDYGLIKKKINELYLEVGK